VEARSKARVELGFVRLDAVDDALVQVRRAQLPRPAGEQDIVAVVNLGEVIDRTGLLRIRQHVLSLLVLDLEEALFDVNVGRAVFAHRAQLDEMAVRRAFAQRPEDVECPRQVVDLREHGAVVVDHGIRRGGLLAVVDDGFRTEGFKDVLHGGVVTQVADVEVDRAARCLFPHLHAVVQRGDGDQRLDVQLHFPTALSEVVYHTDGVAARREIHRRRPA